MYTDMFKELKYGDEVALQITIRDCVHYERMDFIDLTRTGKVICSSDSEKLRHINGNSLILFDKYGYQIDEDRKNKIVLVTEYIKKVIKRNSIIHKIRNLVAYHTLYLSTEQLETIYITLNNIIKEKDVHNSIYTQ